MLGSLHAPLLRSVNEAALVDLLSTGKIRNFAAGVEIAREGVTRMDGLYFVLDGMISQDQYTTHAGRKLTGALGAGEFIGEITDAGQVSTETASASFKAQSSCQLLFIAKSDVDAWLSRHPDEASKFAAYLAGEISYRQEFAQGQMQPAPAPESFS